MSSKPQLSVLAAAAIATLAIALLTAMDALMKGVFGVLGAGQILWLRFALTAALAAVVIAATSHPWPRRDTLSTHLLRALLALISNGCFIYALGKLPLAEVFALTFTAPLFMVLLGSLLLGEHVSRSALVGVLLGFAGAMTIVVGDGATTAAGRPPLALAAVFVSPIAYALSVILLRKLSTGERPRQVVFAQSAWVALLAAPFMLADGAWQAAATNFKPLLAIGILSLAGYLLLVQALAVLPAVRYSVIEYTGLIWAALLGYIFFAERPGIMLWCGAALIVVGALLVVLQKEKVERTS